ncbi:zinc finger CCHC domain-containing protein 7 isoform X2 [Lepisosteus oculatus]|uniref:zinc finger CCHC domain-containing protein 7 isoform X2 n=1 Tax=Lepisosteus oculatus TaxID=7918 RepID=UPI0035F523DE
MFAGYESMEEYEDELYKEPGQSSDSELDSEVEFHLYSQVHYASRAGDGEVEDKVEENGAVDRGQEEEVISITSGCEPEVITLSDSTEEESICVTKGSKMDGFSKALRKRACPSSSTPLPPRKGQRETAAEQAETLSDSEDSDCVESWMILGRGQLAEDRSIQLNLKDHSRESWGSGSGEDNWTISDKDIEAQICNKRDRLRSVNRYYKPNKNVTCRSCGKNGHLSKNCPTPKAPVCILCAEPGHLQRSCPLKHCANCNRPGHESEECIDRAFWNKQCHRCGMRGHFFDDCPEIWRQYHLTTSSGPIVIPDDKEKQKSPAYCYNCSRKGHLGHECKQKRMFNNTFPTLPFITYYDTKPDIEGTNHRVWKRAQELYGAGLLREEPASKRRKTATVEEKKERGEAQPPKPKQSKQPKQQNKKTKTWPEKRKELWLLKQQRRKARQEVVEDTEDFPRGPKKTSSGVPVHPKKRSRSPGLFSTLSQPSKEKPRKLRPKKKAKRRQGRLHDNSFPVDEDLFLIKQKVRRRKR